MMKRWFLIFIIFHFACDSFDEGSGLLEANYYIQDGWLTFTLGNYIEAKDLFNTALLADDDPVYQFLSYVGLGWTHTYHAKSLLFTEEGFRVEDLRDSAGVEYLNAADILSDYSPPSSMDEQLKIQFLDGEAGLYAGSALHYYYMAKQTSANDGSWSTTDSLYGLVLDLSTALLEIAPEFLFPFDLTLDYNDIHIYRAQVYILLNDPNSFDMAVNEFNETTFDCLLGVDTSTILDCITYMGCTDSTAINYNPEALTDDFSCIYEDSP